MPVNSLITWGGSWKFRQKVAVLGCEKAEKIGVTGILFESHIPSTAQPRPEINKKVAFDATFLFIFVELGFKRQNSFVMFERFPRSTQCVGCGAFVTILLRNTCKIYSLSPRPKIKEKL